MFLLEQWIHRVRHLRRIDGRLAPLTMASLCMGSPRFPLKYQWSLNEQLFQPLAPIYKEMICNPSIKPSKYKNNKVTKENFHRWSKGILDPPIFLGGKGPLCTCLPIIKDILHVSPCLGAMSCRTHFLKRFRWKLNTCFDETHIHTHVPQKKRWTTWKRFKYTLTLEALKVENTKE